LICLAADGIVAAQELTAVIDRGRDARCCAGAELIAPDLMAHHGCPPCGRRDVREWAEVCAAGDDAGRDLVVLGDHVRDDHVDVGKGPVQAG
jgi:hypothetical protein